jgi:radical SAM protein with 4Fe4S-binding SPASM domain
MYRIIDAGAKNWQLQLAVAMGNAADYPELLVQPFQLLQLMPQLAALHEEALDHGLLVQPSNTLGYFGPYEHRWRVIDDGRGHWEGCSAGHTGMGIESDGTIKGCPSLPSEDYAGGNVRRSSIEHIWRRSGALPSMQARTRDDLWGYCAGCYYADTCRAGCSWMSHVLFGRPGNNPYCHYRALELSRRGLRERIVKIEDAPGRPFDFGRFQLVVESIDGDGRTEIVDEPPPAEPIGSDGRQAHVPSVLELCRGCHQFVHAHTITCPHCGADVAARAAEYAADLVEADDAVNHVLRLIAASGEADAPLRPGS